MAVTETEKPFTILSDRFREFENETFTETAANSLVEGEELTDAELDTAFDAVSTATNYGQTTVEGRTLVQDFQRLANLHEEQ